MASTLTSILLHITYSTKHRMDLISADHEADLYAYTGGICRRLASPLLAMGGTSNHVHLLVSLSKTLSLSNLMMEIKRDTSKLLRHKLPVFEWQDGYFAFSIGQSGVDQVREYIAGQKAHHAKVDFKDEVRALCRRYELSLTEGYAWD